MSKSIKIKTTEDEFDMLREDGFEPVKGFEYVDVNDIGHDHHGSIESQLIVRKVGTDQLYAGVYTYNGGEGFVVDMPDEYVPVTRKEKIVLVTYYE